MIEDLLDIAAQQLGEKLHIKDTSLTDAKVATYRAYCAFVSNPEGWAVRSEPYMMESQKLVVRNLCMMFRLKLLRAKLLITEILIKSGPEFKPLGRLRLIDDAARFASELTELIKRPSGVTPHNCT